MDFLQCDENNLKKKTFSQPVLQQADLLSTVLTTCNKSRAML